MFFSRRIWTLARRTWPHVAAALIVLVGIFLLPLILITDESSKVALMQCAASIAASTTVGFCDLSRSVTKAEVHKVLIASGNTSSLQRIITSVDVGPGFRPRPCLNAESQSTDMAGWELCQ